MDVATRIADFFRGGGLCAQAIGDEAGGMSAGTAVKLALGGLAAAALLAGNVAQATNPVMPSDLHFKERSYAGTTLLTMIDRVGGTVCLASMDPQAGQLNARLDCQPLAAMPEGKRAGFEREADAMPILPQRLVDAPNALTADYLLPMGTRMEAMRTVYDIDASRICLQVDMRAESPLERPAIPLPFQQRAPIRTVEACTPMAEATPAQRSTALYYAERGSQTPALREAMQARFKPSV